MKPIWIILLALGAAACDGPSSDRAACGTSADCATGEYCARTGDGNVCWPDATPPVVAAVTVACATPARAGSCLRDGTVRVTATASDPEELGAVVASLDADPSISVPMTRAGAVWTADLELRRWPVAFFDGEVGAIVKARDAAGNEVTGASAGKVPVTRLRWVTEVEPGQAVALTPPAVMNDGTVVVGASNGKLYFVGADGSRKRDPLTIGSGVAITAAPAVGERAIWVGSEDFSLRGVALDGSAALQGVVINSEGAIRGSVAVFRDATREWGIAASGSGRLAAASTAGNVNTSGATNAYSTGPVVDPTGSVFAVNALPNASAFLRSYAFDGAFTDRWASISPNVGTATPGALAVDADNSVLTGSLDGRLTRVRNDGTASPLATLGGTVAHSPAILATGDIVVGDSSGRLFRLSGTGTQLWALENLGGAVLAPILLTPSGALFVATEAGNVLGLKADGERTWSANLVSGAGVRTPNIYTPTGQSNPVMSTAVLATSDGKLYAVIVDGQLDTSAPWPKAYHDARNTSNAGTTP